ncbi:hypothetical protein SAMN05443287_1295 [Micromonospora phaseoli]|uniref:Uncharacterized protein n=1 Tax=Micromonospora phaseoli TaxID=1144548 RepID=A0A1H7E328_9ACTN|nr:hypothetical protein [Micromonospora phaseoli]PZV88123.1 hypothetical protein CLV64_1264 [Micromonospora phaseoli]GIJ81491.1 hypothetical protein Xph01_59230 [Micromonospora phaseoli]SEK07497.1 hypothetical protein SAMN05443287_1295 [Micromonospora phaseoli]
MEAEDGRRIVALPLGQAIEIARVLESVVVSLDRIGSREAGGEADVHTLGRFMTAWFVGPRLSSARTALWNAIAQVIGEEAVEEIAASTPAFPDPVPQEVRTLIQERRKWNEEQST